MPVPNASKQMLVYDWTEKCKNLYNRIFAELERWETNLVDFININTPSFFWR